jgi:hypothetical protein
VSRKLPVNRNLTSASLALAPRCSPLRGVLLVFLGLIMGLLAAGVFWFAFDATVVPERGAPAAAMDEAGLDALREAHAEQTRANEALKDSLSAAITDLEIEKATRQELERQLGLLNQQLKEANEALEFFRSNTDGAQ